MKLSNKDGVSFDLSIDGYQFPETLYERWDSNWLIVCGHVCCSRGEWVFRDPCLTTFELRQLADWLDALAGGTSTSTQCSFVEPNLAFDYQVAPNPTVLVCFAHESAPPWQLGDERFTGFTLPFDLDLNDLARAASHLRQFLAKFPERGK